MNSVCVLTILCAVVITTSGHPTSNARSYFSHHLIRRVAQLQPKENNVEGSSKEEMVVMGLIARGCDNPVVIELAMAIQRIFSSPLIYQLPVAHPDQKPSIEDTLTYSCAVTNIRSLEELAAVTGLPEKNLRQTYPAYVQIARGVRILIQFEQDNNDIPMDPGMSSGVDAMMEVMEILDREGLLDLE